MMEHSAGPWLEEHNPDKTRWVVDAKGDTVALVIGKAPGDYALVRSAPELLEIARQLRALLHIAVKEANHRGAVLTNADLLPWVKRLAEIEARFGIMP